jgi:hypothetical protein
VGKDNRISRRDFLKFAGVNLAGVALRGLPENWADWASGWPALSMDAIPASVREILERVPETVVLRNGYLHLLDGYQFSKGRVPLAPTDWNLERSKTVDELFPDLRWGIVLHWYGDPDYFDRSVKGYLRGFNSVRRIADFETRTSAHFLIGDKTPATEINNEEDFFGIVQTQMPSPKGVPYLASHLNNYAVRDFEGDHYFINALYKLGLAEAPIDPVLKDLFEGPKVDPNFRTIAIEITGSDFDNPDHCLPPQKIANVLSVVWALMKRYQVRAIDVLGHNEIQLSNSDPGKKFVGLIRYLLGVKALIEGDAMMRYQVFGSFLGENDIPAEAVTKYFSYVRDYLVLVGLPVDVFEWEAWSKYWFVVDQISDPANLNSVMQVGKFPIQGDSTTPGSWFLDPDNHEGIDIYLAGEGNRMVKSTSGAYLVTNGICTFIGENRGFHHGKMAVFRHRQPDGAELLTIYGHLNAIGDIEVGKAYPAGHRLGSVGGLDDGTHAFLHFSTAYGATWDSYLSHSPNVPLSANAKWVQRHFLHPEEFLMKLIV